MSSWHGRNRDGQNGYIQGDLTRLGGLQPLVSSYPRNEPSGTPPNKAIWAYGIEGLLL